MTVSAYVFDAYGTLFDVHSAVRKHADALGPAGARMSLMWRAKQLEYSWVRSLMGSYSDFWKLTEEALDYALEANDLGRGDGHLRSVLLDAYWTLDAYPDVLDTLTRLRKSGAKIGILSNGSPEMLSAAITSAKLDGLVDSVFSVDAVKIFKTAPEVYQMVTDSWEMNPDDISFQSANRWDVAGAHKFGFQTVWINRNEQPDEYKNHVPNRVIATLNGL
ncbi:MAG: haloacid dehalogenase type II [Ahrensia sp.]|nr:haloacid dehalogenase type II [Ahrensia sp.]